MWRMRTLSLRILVTTVAVALATGVAATPAHAAALPSRATWLADVQAVTDQAAGYLDDRLPASGVRAAIVLDIDNTALQSKYKPYDATPAVLALARQARADGAAVFFVTARPEIIEAATELNLSAVGYRWTDIYTRLTFDFSDNQTLKTKARIDIEKRGYTIVANVGNSATDLGGGHAERTFKLPDYDGQLD
ncbi:putative acid phosphatase of HAD superfamily subfamily IIIB [Actinoplanes xinjiangensis]|uniref:Putative acid phosphatase of HAD superfamily subfamily IIIB n=2 Tax=Actinoplanes xinjiangensis TaxID=512350 RepID=A0A316FLL3_9ACTN|nr:putative acid phosphatase of HAD superfamily subfamily IIIB [Actinoplanes xinjiangensis]GIF38762.1 acid phosphatase [Actinoplanes xinjiangensis]